MKSYRHSSRSKNSRLLIGVCAALVAIAAPLQLTGSAVYADRYDDQIRAIQSEVNQYQEQAGELQKKADSLASAVAVLTTQKKAIQARLNLSQAKNEKLSNEIEASKIKLAENREALGEIIANLYIGDRVSPLEMLASSKNVSEYMDKQEFRLAASEQLNETIDEIKKLEKKLKDDQAALKIVIANQQTQRNELAAKEAEKQRLLADTRGKEAAYRSLTAKKNSEIDQLRAQQAAEIRARASAGGGFTALPGDPNSGGYPAKWANAPMNSYVDDWGMYSRQCVSYAAYKVASTYGNMPYWGGRGNANEWGSNARGAGIPVSSVPKAGTVGVQYSGQYGHVAWVESVNSDGTLTISQFNANWTGDYSRWIVDRSFFNEYIYFGG